MGREGVRSDLQDRKPALRAWMMPLVPMHLARSHVKPRTPILVLHRSEVKNISP